mmetsp:Transcript_57563/g.114252  ORF Transcript_57563/g.114252 Transcript_57563/m.114252 type:complete len:109 (-) Transcript_57563:133-459(-)
MLYINIARGQARVNGDIVALESLQGIIMIGRCWRFVRVGHGIALAIHDVLDASNLEAQNKIEELRQVLHVLEAKSQMESALNIKHSEEKGMERVHQLLRELGRHYGGQ